MWLVVTILGSTVLEFITCYVQCLMYNKKLRHTHEQENGIHSQEEKISIDINMATTQILNLAEFKVISLK